ncbi:hypothetical protein GCM10011584_29120 [Nocardioides phosphati]|uniref:N-acetyltransferase domain-containing protein n=1 Tax=Nocardioides phosphati TaxID=1867775 RepID=A0ABQ2NF14_9ACTN|nr:hypothetical protein [Nocardioides phosphati]GGO92521.1 hypothetical protein GCM10011584_29120 [Nocardioides phosphati]
MTIRPLDAGDVHACASLHRRAFPAFFLSQLGERFLREFYRSFVDADGAITAVSVDPGGALQGVVVGTTTPQGFFKRMLIRRWWAFGLASIGLLIRQPRRLPRVLRAVTYRGDYPVRMTGSLLSSICVEPTAPAGTGQSLLRAFVEGSAALGVRSAHLTTDRHQNERANRFYQRAGWLLVGHYSTPEGREMNCYQWPGQLTKDDDS